MRGREHHHHTHSHLYRTMRILESISIFLLLGTVLVMGLYFLGNYQEFLDRSQHMLLELLRLLGLLCAFSSLYYSVSLVVWMIQRRHVLLARLVYALVATAVGVAVAALISLLKVILAPT